AHDHGVLHRDIKLANVLLNRYGRPLLTDFSVSAVQTQIGQQSSDLGGTLSYMAPEHFDAFVDRSKEPEVDERADIYSFGVVLFQLRSGRLPFDSGRHGDRSQDALCAMAAQRRLGAPELPPDLDVPPALSRVVRRCLEPSPDSRYPSADELAHA